MKQWWNRRSRNQKFVIVIIGAVVVIAASKPRRAFSMIETEDSAARVIAVHEAGHAVAMAILGIGPTSVSVIKSDDELGMTEASPPPVADYWEPLAWEEVNPDTGASDWRAYLESRIMEKLAGDIATKLFLLKNQTLGAHDDEEAVEHFEDMLAHGSVKADIDSLRIRVKTLLEQPKNRDAIIAVAAALERTRHLSGEEVFELVYGGSTAAADWRKPMGEEG